MSEFTFKQRLTSAEERNVALMAFYEDGHTIQETAEQFKLSVSYTKNLIHGIVNVTRPLELTDRAWAEAHHNGMSIEDIANKWNAFAPFVEMRIKRYYPIHFPSPF